MGAYSCVNSYMCVIAYYVSMHICMSTCIYVCQHVYIYVNMHIRMSTCVSVHVYRCVCAYFNVYVRRVYMCDCDYIVHV